MLISHTVHTLRGQLWYLSKNNVNKGSICLLHEKNVVRAHHSSNVLGSSEKANMTMTYVKIFIKFN